MNKPFLIFFLAISLLALMAVMFYSGKFYEAETSPKPTKAKIMTELGCLETDSTTIEEWYFNAKFLCSIGECDRVKPICN